MFLEGEVKVLENGLKFNLPPQINQKLLEILAVD